MRKLATACAALILLSACSSADVKEKVDPTEVRGTVTFEKGLPAGVEPATDGGVGVGVTTDGTLQIITFGSSSNPMVVTEATLEGTEIEVELGNDTNKPSTMDFVPTTSTVTFEGGLAEGKQFKVDIDDVGEITVGSNRELISWIAPKK